MVGIFLGIAFFSTIKNKLKAWIGSRAEMNSTLKASHGIDTKDEVAASVNTPEVTTPPGHEHTSTSSVTPDESRASSVKIGNFFKTAGSFVLMFLVYSTIKYVVSFTATEARVAASKYTSWDNKFKNGFIKSCEDASRIVTRNEFTAEELTHPQSTQVIDKYVVGYCACMAKITEENHIVTTKYNKWSRNIAQAEKESSDDVSRFVNSTEGQKAIASCKESAIALLKK